MITLKDYKSIIHKLGKQAEDDIKWAESRSAPTSASDFAFEAIYVICNSGMKHTVAREIFNKIYQVLPEGRSASTVFKHPGKSDAIDTIWRNRETFLAQYLLCTTDEARLAFCASLPWIGEITKYHLAKNFGADVAKPDVHLKRLADLEGVTAQQLCERLSKESGHRIATVDTILWRGCATGILNSKTGIIREAVYG